jgi:hypothetical protein
LLLLVAQGVAVEIMVVVVAVLEDIEQELVCLLPQELHIR